GQPAPWAPYPAAQPEDAEALLALKGTTQMLTGKVVEKSGSSSCCYRKSCCPICSFEPARPLFRCIALTVVPYLWAMADNVSPFFTTYTSASSDGLADDASVTAPPA